MINNQIFSFFHKDQPMKYQILLFISGILLLSCNNAKQPSKSFVDIKLVLTSRIDDAPKDFFDLSQPFNSCKKVDKVYHPRVEIVGLEESDFIYQRISTDDFNGRKQFKLNEEFSNYEPKGLDIESRISAFLDEYPQAILLYLNTEAASDSIVFSNVISLKKKLSQLFCEAKRKKVIVFFNYELPNGQSIENDDPIQELLNKICDKNESLDQRLSWKEELVEKHLKGIRYVDRQADDGTTLEVHTLEKYLNRLASISSVQHIVVKGIVEGKFEGEAFKSLIIREETNF